MMAGASECRSKGQTKNRHGTPNYSQASIYDYKAFAPFATDPTASLNTELRLKWRT